MDVCFYEKGPDDKVSIIESLPHSLMIGDGANDAMALSKAWVSVAVQGSLEVSLVAADVYFTTPGVDNLPLLFELSKRTRRIVRLNFIFSLFYNCLGILLVVSGYISPLFAAILMPISSLTVFLISVIGLR